MALAACVAVSLCVSTAARAGPWARPLGSAYAKLGFSYYSANSSFSRGIAAEGLAYDAFTLNLYTEIGLPWRLTLIADVPYLIATNSAQSGVQYTNHTFGDGRFELNAQLLERFPLSLGMEVKAPLYQSVVDRSNGGVIRVDGLPWPAENFPDVGDGNVDLTPKILVGHSFYPLPVWITGAVGYRARLAGYADGFWGSVNAGGFVWPEHLAIGLYGDGIVNVQEDPNPREQASREYVYLEGYALVPLAPWVDGLTINLSAGGVVAARQSSRGYNLGVGVSYEY